MRRAQIMVLMDGFFMQAASGSNVGPSMRSRTTQPDKLVARSCRTCQAVNTPVARTLCVRCIASAWIQPAAAAEFGRLVGTVFEWERLDRSIGENVGVDFSRTYSIGCT
jgi:hypothetical protein